MLNPNSMGFLRLLQRSPDCGAGWRTVSSVLWKLVEDFPEQELLEKEVAESGGGKVRLSPRGLIVVEYAV